MYMRKYYKIVYVGYNDKQESVNVVIEGEMTEDKLQICANDIYGVDYQDIIDYKEIFRDYEDSYDFTEETKEK